MIPFAQRRTACYSRAIFVSKYSQNKVLLLRPEHGLYRDVYNFVDNVLFFDNALVIRMRIQLLMTLRILITDRIHADAQDILASQDYQYVVPRTRLDRARELLNMSPILRYVCVLLQEIVEHKGEKLLLYAHCPRVAWLVTMFCLNWGVESAWLRAGMSRSQRNNLTGNFNKPDGSDAPH